MSLQESILSKIQAVEQHIIEACQRSSRPRQDVCVIAVTKYVSLEVMRIAMNLGLTNIGENRWQDAKEKWEVLHNQGTWHFIGHLQTNKVKDVIGKFSCIHSLDRLSLAEELNRIAKQRNISIDVLIQLNVSGEQSKFGLAPAQLVPFIHQIRSLEHLHISGLMTMAPHESDPEKTRPIFHHLRELRNDLNKLAIVPYEVKHLSMGMSNDYIVAIEEGATMVRLGSAIFTTDFT